MPGESLWANNEKYQNIFQIKSLKMNMNVNQDDVNNLQGLNLTCGKGANLAIAPPELAIMEEGWIGFYTTNDQEIFWGPRDVPRIQGKFLGRMGCKT